VLRLPVLAQARTRERKRMVRLLIEDITIRKDEQIQLDIRFRGGATKR
jgi:hypothetical protein